MRKLLVVVLSITILAVFYNNSSADEITLGADVWCPLNCEPDSNDPGYVVELAKEIFAKSGHTVTYKIIPWARAIKECREGRISGIIGAYVDDAPDFVFPENEIGMIGNSIFTNIDNNWKYTGISSLSTISLGVIRDYAYTEEIDQYIEKYYSEPNRIQIASGKTPLENNINKLNADRMDALIEAEPVFWYTANKMGMKDKLRSAGKVGSPAKAYVAFSPSMPKSKEYAKILSDGIEELRKSGKLLKICEKYGLKDWK
ncbi:MAG: transporter substrate-binding domain-containing protein [Desulfobacterales bacterium]|nr:transporter substrate-binding domain-containing protein [Desulfobacterales bacterium]